MAVKKCCIEKCKSCSSRKEDQGVTYHKYPKDTAVRDRWVRVTRHTRIDGTFVCSRHFCKNDFKMYQDTKYVLKSGAVPSIFPWTKSKVKTKMDELDSIGVEPSEDKNSLLSSRKDMEPENLDAIKNYIESHDKIKPTPEDKKYQNEPETPKPSITEANENIGTNIEETKERKEEPLVIATSVMNLILSDADNKFKIKKDAKAVPQNSIPDKDSNSVALSVGSKVEARDFDDCWHCAEIIEVDYDEMEVLVHYDVAAKKHDEWISVNSPRLRPQTVKAAVVVEGKPKVAPTEVTKEEEKTEEKPKLMYAVGERCLARWRDNRRFVATIQKDLGNGDFEIMFDDGFQWKCTATRLSKLKDKGKTDPLSDNRATPSPVPGAGPSTGFPVPAQVPIFHTHLFDPTRDYLGTKSERREMKRKLNIKEIFNIGQKQRRKDTPPKEDKPKVQKERKKPSILKKNVKVEPKVEAKIETEVKRDIPDAVASIIGTVSKNENNVKVKKDIKEEYQIEPKKEKVGTKEEPVSTMKIKDEIKEEIDKKGKFTPTQLEEQYTAPIKADAEDGNIQEENKNSTETADTQDIDPYFDEDTQSAKLSDDEEFSEQAKLSDDQIDLLSTDPVLKEECKLESFEKPDGEKHEEVIDRIKEAINKLEDGLNEVQRVDSPKTIVKEAPKSELKVSALVIEELKTLKSEEPKPVEPKDVTPAEPKVLEPAEQKVLEPADTEPPKPEEPESTEPAVTKLKSHHRSDRSKKSLSKIKKNKKLRLLQEKKKVKSQVEQVKCELEAMKKQMEEIRKQMLIKTEALAVRQKELPESCLLPDEWCCRWLNGLPLGTVVESEGEPREMDVNNKLALPRCSVKVEDRRLPEGWTKLMVRRSLGNSAGKWDVCLVSPDNKRLHTKTDMRNYMEANPDPSLQQYEHALFDFGVHVKLSRRMGWVKEDGTVKNVSANSPMPFIKRKKLGIKRGDKKAKRRKISTQHYIEQGPSDQSLLESSGAGDTSLNPHPTLEDGYVYVGSLKVQVIDNLLRCPAEGCLKNFRNNTLLQMHIKHYHRELRIMLGATPKVLDLAYARTRPMIMKTKRRYQRDNKIIKVKIPRPPKRVEMKPEVKEIPEPVREVVAPSKLETERIPRSLDSPLMRQLANRPVKRPKVLLPVRRPEPIDPPEVVENVPDFGFDDSELGADIAIPPMEVLDFETAINAHTVSKAEDGDKKGERRKFATISKAPTSEDEEMLAMNSDFDSQSSFPGSTTPDSKTNEPKGFVQNLSSLMETNEEQKDSASYIYTETGERIKIERMKAEEIINCHCGFREEDGLMVQCELCLCWQHALCHNIQRETDVPEKYTCSICLNPRRGRRSQRFLHDQERLQEGVLPGAAPDPALRRSHQLSGALLRVADSLHALRVKYYVATKKNHPKLYLWAKDWEDPEVTFAQEKLNAEYSDLNMIINNIGKENLPVKTEDLSNVRLDMQTPTSEGERLGREGSLGSHSLLGGLLSSPVGPSVEMPISTSELEKLAKTVQEQEAQRAIVSAPQPEAAIENGACRERLLRHLQRCQTLIDARLDTLESDIVELEAQNPSFEDDETADYFPRTKQTIAMLMRDLDTMEELGMLA